MKRKWSATARSREVDTAINVQLLRTMVSIEICVDRKIWPEISEQYPQKCLDLHKGSVVETCFQSCPPTIVLKGFCIRSRDQRRW
ncbi:hypothetical protein RRG08_041146 [Elysia crispata]|uniref:Uncharacterized protein n=1 Tax=Elysia crispata TaxID=231223 RepID=A0AAE0XYT5_9GAST|nr:hypothetical protein RRG08_041146 [Elysia crispata]